MNLSSIRDLRDAFEEVSAEFKLAQAQQRLMANSSSEEGDDGVVSHIYLTNSTIFVFVNWVSILIVY